MDRIHSPKSNLSRRIFSSNNWRQVLLELPDYEYFNLLEQQTNKKKIEQKTIENKDKRHIITSEINFLHVSVINEAGRSWKNAEADSRTVLIHHKKKSLIKYIFWFSFFFFHSISFRAFDSLCVKCFLVWILLCSGSSLRFFIIWWIFNASIFMKPFSYSFSIHKSNRSRTSIVSWG